MRVLLLALALAGCGPQISGESLVIIDVETDFYRATVFDNDNGLREPAIEAIRRGLHIWDSVGAKLRLPDEVGNSIAPHFGIHWSNVDTPSEAGVCWPGLGYADIYMSKIDGSQNLTTTVAHELGHAMGLGHISNDGIMNPADNEQQLSAADAAQFRGVWN